MPDKQALTDYRHTVSDTISLPFRGTFHLSLTVLVHYRSQNVFSLTGWSRQIQTGFHVPRPTWDTATADTEFRLQECHLLRYSFPTVFDYPLSVRSCSPATPANKLTGLGSFPFARHYLGNHYLFSFPAVTLDVSIHRVCLKYEYLIIEYNLNWVAPFGNSRVKACLQLSETYRSKPRPSSPFLRQGIHRMPFLLNFSILFNNLTTSIKFFLKRTIKINY